VSYYCRTLNKNTHNRFTALFSRTTRVSRCQKESSTGLYGARGDIRGRHTDNPAGRHSIRTNQRSTSVIPPFLRGMPFLPQPSHFILAWDRHQVCWLAHPGHLQMRYLWTKCSVWCFRFDVHGFTADCPQDEPGVQEAAQRCEFGSFFLTAVCIY